ncbi:tripartite tricarboxylate transporter substrate binding protein [Microbacteriaceae bacterium K1510]|nr:tripartite tricarboxylate transporter substrate binding protein [Microbacteriaceae bacterium K1510]
MNKRIRRTGPIWLALSVAALLLTPAQADDFPSRPIRLLVGAPPGGTTDTIARAIANPMSEALKQPVLVENRPGAGGNIAADQVAKSAADGYTLLVSFSSHTINASLYPKLPYDPVGDFTPITKIATVPSLLVGNPKVPAKDLKALIELAKAKPDKLTLGIGGIGSSLHLAGEKFKLMTGTRLLNVPYKGTAPALTDVLGGQVDLMFISYVTGAEQVKSGNLRAYGVTTAKRLPAFPDLPAIGEVVPGFESSAWFGVFGPGKLPAAVTDKLHAVIVAALADPTLRERLQNEGAMPVGDSSAEFTAFVKEDIERWAPIVKASGATPN